jgi:bifunctional non-homologous end joining protein LigD
MSRADAATVQIGRHRLRLTNLDKVLWPENGFTKGQMINYYTRIADVLLPYLRDRPATMKRYPNGVSGDTFFEKRCPEHRPSWVRITQVRGEGTDQYLSYCLIQNLATLVWIAQLGTIELHVPLSRRRSLTRPDAMVFDLDPGPPATVVECCQVALELRQQLAEHRLQAFCKTSGSKGLQVYVPLNRPVSYDNTKRVSRGLAERLQRQQPELVVHRQRKELRAGKVLVDWGQNDPGRTMIAVYSLRARPQPTVSTPVEWDEVEDCARAGDPEKLVFTADQVLARVAHRGDLFRPLLDLRQKLPKAA